MRVHLGLAVSGLVIATSGVAAAHFRLEEPPDALKVSSTYGDPEGGDQKTSPCGTGTASGATVKRYKPGSTLKLRVVETIPHGGHYRVALAQNRSQLVDPVPVVTNGDCKSAPIQTTPVAPVLADGLFKHGQLDVRSGQVWETDVKLPTTPCVNCTLQVIEFMTPHAPGCFYYHCSTISVTEDGEDGGAIAVDAGGDGSGSGTGQGSGTGSGNGSGSGSKSKGNPADDSADETDGGCAVGSSSNANGMMFGVLAFVSVAALRRRRR